MSKKRETILTGLNLNSIREGAVKADPASAMIMPRSSDYKKEVERQSDRITEVLGAEKADDLLRKDNLLLLEPAKVHMWALADRDRETLNKKDCKDLIDSMHMVGQAIPCIGRPVEGAENEVELIVGARRLFAAQTIAKEDKDFRLLAYIKPLDDRSAFLIMDAENRIREDVSDWARAKSYQQAIESGKFKGREQLATQLAMPTAKLSKLLAFFDLPEEISGAFPSKPAFRANWAYELLRGYRKIAKNPQARAAVLKKAAALRERQLKKTGGKKHATEPEDVYKALLREIERRILEQTKDEQSPAVVGYTEGYNGFKLSVSNKGRMSFILASTVERERIERAIKALEQILGEDGEVSRRNQD